MTTPVLPDWWEFVLLLGAAYRVYRIIGQDFITRPLRERVTNRSEVTGQIHRGYRAWWDELLHCPWCLGFWVCLLFGVAYWLSPEWTLWLSVPFALSTYVGMVSKLDD